MEKNNSLQSAKPTAPSSGRIEVGFNIIVQIALVIAALVMLNWLGNKYYARLDWSRGKNITLSPQTKAVLGTLEKPVQVIVMFAMAGEVENDAQLLLREYQFAAKGKLTVEEVDPYANLSRAKELQAQYKFGANENVVIFTYEGRHKFVNSGDLAEFEQLDEMAMMMRRQPQMLGFKGEQVFTSTLLELTETKQNKLYLVAAHGEYDGSSRELAGFRDFLTRQNLKFDTLKLADKDKIPDDASMIAILGPRFDFSERDLKLLTEYWERKGRIFICAGWTNNKTPNLNEWLAVRGVRLQNDAVIRVVSLGNMAGMQPLEAVVMNQGSPITKGLEGVGSDMFGPTQSLALDRNLEKTANLRLTGLLTAPEGFWGEMDYTPGNRTNIPMFDPKRDHPGPLTLGVAVERGGSGDPKVKLETSRMVVFGNGDFLSDKGLQTGQASLELALNSVNWLLNRDNLISLPPKVKEKQSLKLSDAQIGTIRWWVMLFIPVMIAVFGLYHLMWRSGKNIIALTLWLAVVFLGFIASWLTVQWRLGLWKPTLKMSPTFWITIGIAVAIGVAAAIANTLEQKRRVKPQD